MDNFETPYEVEDEFIECTVCEKSIRGETLYKIHLTTLGHIKKEEGFVTGGRGFRKRAIPDFKDISEYLDYLKLDEPIIGLHYLEQVTATDPQSGPRYLCKPCHLTANLAEMVHHVIGRKHRQKYVEVQRPDLVTWDKQSLTNQGGKIMRAKAEIIERQDGRGQPVPIASRGSEGRLNMSRALPKQYKNRDQRFLQTRQDVPSRLTGPKDYENEYGHQEFSDTPQFHQEEPYRETDRMVYQSEDDRSDAHMEEERGRVDYRRNNYGGEYVEDPQGSTEYEPGGDACYYPQEKVPMPHGHKPHVEYYPEKAASYRRPNTESDPLKEFYSEEVRRQQIRSEHQRTQRIYPEEQRQWSLDRESVRHTSKNRASMQGFSEPEAKRHCIAPMENDQSHHHLFNVIKDYQHTLREPLEEPGPSINALPSSERKMHITKSMSGIPEPFRRFLTGATGEEQHGKRRRKSRFSDATAEEVELTQEMIRNEFGPPNPKFARPSRLNVPLRPETHATHNAELYTESQTPHHSEDYHGGGSENVFDMLKGLEIENAEDANFLKSKLCNLLKEFKAKKSEKTVTQGGTVFSRDYNRLNTDPQLSSGLQYDRPLDEDLDLRRPQDLSFKDDHRRQSWKQQEYTPDEQLQEHHHSVRREPEHNYRGRYEDVFGCPGMSHTFPATCSDETVQYTERLEEPMHPIDHRPAAKRYFDSHSPSPSRHMEEGRRMHRIPRYSNNLDKITSTLLELVARK
ncbi:hypothetical protein JOB18_038260 [Solea senegalensis]|uniref:C2H2-type domain-containing protein n=2 Tax=Solea senegalensis TaxID=28829 RepID=A0AAV6R6H8_SOLSE|nr:uncharacterized protein si:ch211-13c6.2 isoform X1 [Solea senegalensis]KAG7501037.1 hypothetical protein JOB18_038260 [Solea senegalensis]